MLLRAAAATALLIATGAENPACRLSASTLPRCDLSPPDPHPHSGPWLMAAGVRSFKYETMYGWHASMANFTNVAQSSSLHEILQFHNDTGRPGILELQGVFFAAAPKPMRGQVVKPSGLADFTAMLPTLRPLIQQKIIIGFMLGDEIVWNNARPPALPRPTHPTPDPRHRRAGVVGGPELDGGIDQGAVPGALPVLQRGRRASLGQLQHQP